MIGRNNRQSVLLGIPKSSTKILPGTAGDKKLDIHSIGDFMTMDIKNWRIPVHKMTRRQ